MLYAASSHGAKNNCGCGPTTTARPSDANRLSECHTFLRMPQHIAFPSRTSTPTPIYTSHPPRSALASHTPLTCTSHIPTTTSGTRPHPPRVQPHDSAIYHHNAPPHSRPDTGRWPKHDPYSTWRGLHPTWRVNESNNEHGQSKVSPASSGQRAPSPNTQTPITQRPPRTIDQPQWGGGTNRSHGT